MRPALIALVLAGCSTDVFLELHPREVALGDGLSAPYYPQVMTCDPGDVYPAGCDQQIVNVQRVAGRGAIEVTLGDDGGFWATGMETGHGEVQLAAGGFDERLGIEVAPVAYSMVTWWGHDTEPAPFGEYAPESVGLVFTGSEIELWQKHYRVTRDELASVHVSDLLDAVLYGHTTFELVPGTAHVKLVEMTEPRRWAAPYPRIALATGTIPGTATVTTRAGGELAVTVVDTTAIARLHDGYLTSGEPIDRYSPELSRFMVAPLDAAGRMIRGCPAAGPTVSDTAGILVVTPLPARDACEFRLELAPGKTWQDTTIVVQWNQAELRVPVDAS